MADVRIEGLCKGWDFPVIDRLDLQVAEGEFFIVVGPSGVGKTTLLRLIAGLEIPDAGRILVGERDISAEPPYRRRVAMTFESYALYPHMTVFQNIASALVARRLDRNTIRQRVGEVAKLLRIDHLLDRRPGEISGGQKQRTALGRTLVADPEVFLLDEPISHLDAKIRHELRQQFHTLEALRRVATLYVTHDYAEALSLGDRIGVLAGGKLVQIGDAREVFERPLTRTVAENLGQPPIRVMAADLAGDGDGMAVTIRDSALTIPVDPAHAGLLRARANGAAIEVGIRPQAVWAVIEGPAPAGCHVAEMVVDQFQALGARGVLILDAGGAKLTALSSPDIRFGVGDRLQVAIDPSALLYFDAARGINLVR